MPEIDDRWKIWIWQNIGRGCHKDHVFKALHERGFSWEAIRDELRYEPNLPLDQIEVPMVDAAADLGRLESETIVRHEVAPHLWELPGVLSPGDCRVLIETARDRLTPSTVVTDNEKAGVEGEGMSESRTSSTVAFEIMDAPNPAFAAVTAYLRRVIADLTHLPEEHQEVLQVTHYAEGQKFDPHRDDFSCGSEYLRWESERGGQRLFTFMVYLNDVEEGGETEFPSLGVAVPAERGKGVFWANVTSDGRPYPASLHGSVPVVRGEKWVLVCWIREGRFGAPLEARSVSDLRGLDYWLEPQLPVAPGWVAEDTERQRREIPYLNAGGPACRGFEKRQVDADLMAEIRSAFESIRGELRIEDNEAIGAFVDTSRPEIPPALYYESREVNELVHRILKPLHEEWCRFPLEPSACYGFRVYLAGAMLRPHVDRPATHVISSTLCVASDLYAPWDLQAFDTDGREHRVDLAPGELLLYESAHIVHGRPVPLNGRYYAGLFIHYQPAEDHDLWVEDPRAWYEKHRP